MQKLVLDTNIYIRALRDDKWARELDDLLTSFAPSVYLSAVVASELKQGARSGKGSSFTASFTEPFRRRNRIVTPSVDSWYRAAEAVAEVARRERQPVRDVSRTLQNDALIALSSRAIGATVITQDGHDFERLAAVVAISFTTQWPVA